MRVYRTPTTNGYQSIQFFTVEQTLTLAAFPEFNIKELEQNHNPILNDFLVQL